MYSHGLLFFILLSSLALHVLDPDIPIARIGGGFQNVPPKEEFITMFPRKSIVELHDTPEVVSTKLP